MAKHLTQSDINKIKGVIHLWEGKLTWEALCEAVKSRIGKRPTRQSLNMHKDIVDAYLLKKKLIKEIDIPLKKPANLTIAAKTIKYMAAEIELLKKQNNRYKEQFTRWQYGAYKHGMKEHQLNASLPEKRTRNVS
ncbi:hypothetical protein [Pectobacterium carotovorum]|uniref:hypothetical protein n=1 Tax=Pectobacterium carotovorum TaxID=554 RepID=UPI0005047E0D|nr:hypothetical protein [Pectobacterium carotovorum]KFX00726.1 hypothetical protein JV33_04810 [Pectobacterium carotovorum subsp. carotovorum]KML70308.1 hypothetical protein G032_08125 [Pectobacterium carotovorum subsp. carotovorum ICMP 5702]SHG90906.1 hypothetical protein SAMN05444147_10560 [Pectobacterium carotovorum]